MQDCLTQTLSFLFLPPICPHLPLSTPPRQTLSPLLPVCLSVFTAHAHRDEREEPLANARDHHHHCDWCHSDCCLGDGSGFAEQAPPPKVQGMVEENVKNVDACFLSV